MDVTGVSTAGNGCRGVSEILNRVGEKWTVQVVVALRERPRRFNDLKRQVTGISQQMLTRTLKTVNRRRKWDPDRFLPSYLNCVEALHSRGSRSALIWTPS
jgi:hypothetical protein